MKYIIVFALCIIFFAYAPQNSIANEVDEKIATLINVNGFLCARVVSVRPLSQKDVYEVKCTEYRGGSGTVDYIMNSSTGIVFKM